MDLLSEPVQAYNSPMNSSIDIKLLMHGYKWGI